MIHLNLEKLIERWRKEADAYMKQVDEARNKKLSHDCMLGTATTLRQCAKELEYELRTNRNIR